MSNLNHLVKNYTMKYNSRIKKICSPLTDSLPIVVFDYYSIEEDGRFVSLSNKPEALEHYYSEKLFINNPYLTHPKLLSSGYTIISSTKDASFRDQETKCFEKYGHGDPLLILRKKETIVEGFFFAPDIKFSNPSIYFPILEHLNKFSNYFVQETQWLINKIKSENYNLKDEKGQCFFQRDAGEVLSSEDDASKKFLKAIYPLSRREMQCLEMFKQGYSAQSTGAILGLSQRTVEYYFEKIKDKLGCTSKWELLTK